MRVLTATAAAAALVAAAALPATAVPAATVAPRAATHRECSWLDAGQGLIRTSALGSPRRTVGGVAHAGAVEVHPDYWSTASPVVTLSSSDVGQPLTPTGRFGSAVVGANVTFPDYCADLVIGMPGADGGRGAVVVVPDLGSGFAPSQAFWLPTSSLGLHPGDELGTSLGVVESTKGTLIVAGAPGRDLTGAADAGALVSWWVPMTREDPATYPATPVIPATSAPQFHLQGSGGLLGHSDPNDRFGSVMATNVSASRITVGIPNEDVGRAKDTGSVAVLTFADGALTGNALLWQGHGLPGTSKKGDHLGASVVDIGYMRAFGVPGKDANGRKDSGAIIAWPPGASTTAKVITQNTRGVPDRSEKGDAFGAALAAGSGLRLAENSTMAVGVPGEDVGTRRNVGAVTLVTWMGEVSPAHFGYSRLATKGLARGDAFGSALTVVSDEPDMEEDTADILFAGAPGEDRPHAANAGRYYVARRTAAGNPPAATYANGVKPNERFGG